MVEASIIKVMKGHKVLQIGQNATIRHLLLIDYFLWRKKKKNQLLMSAWEHTATQKQANC